LNSLRRKTVALVREKRRAMGVARAIPIVVISAWAEDSAHSAGVSRDGWLEKPFELHDIYTIVARYAGVPAPP